MLNGLVSQQRQSLEYFYRHLSLEKMEQVLTLMTECEGALLFSGVGKSGLVAQGIASLFLSVGTKAHFLSPADALHGEIALVSDKDLFFALSKSGETDELLSLLPFVKKRGARVIAWVNRTGSRLEKEADLTVVLPLDRELCPFDLAPTTSTALQLLFGNTLAVAKMEKDRFSKEAYGLNHPSGAIGRRIAIRVSDLMLQGGSLPVCRPDQKLIEVIHELSEKRCGCLLPVDGEGKLLGIFTDGDMRRAVERLGSQALETKLEELMTRRPKEAHPDELAWQAMERMEEDPARPVMVLPVVKKEQLVGLIKLHDILQKGF
jgi:arabinose-5-phosphate isomerase